jgi:S1-C subfamily serine protease
MSGSSIPTDTFSPSWHRAERVERRAPPAQAPCPGGLERAPGTVARVGATVTRVSWPVRRILATAAACTVALSACGDDPSSGSPADAARASAVSVDARGCGPQPDTGSGAVLGDDVVVTAAHVVAGADEIIVSDGTGSYAGIVVWFDPDQDVAAVRLESPDADPTRPPTALLDGSVAPGTGGALAIVDGDTVTVRDVEVLRAVTIETTDIHHTVDVRRSGYEIAATIEPGDSGALVHVDGGAIGIVWARSTRHDERAWVVALPDELTDPDRRADLVVPVDAGDCPP